MRRRRVSEEERSCREGMETIPKDQTSRLNLQVNTHSLRMCVKIKGSPVLEFASQYYENTESISLMETIPKGQRSRLNLEVSTHFIHSQRNSVRLKGSHSKHKINFKRFISVQFWQSSPPPFFFTSDKRAQRKLIFTKAITKAESDYLCIFSRSAQMICGNDIKSNIFFAHHLFLGSFSLT